MDSRPLLLLDAASLYYRAYFGVPESVRAPDGTPVNAVRGFLDMLAVLLVRYRPERLVICLDADWRPQWRVALLPSYKAHRLVDGSPAEEATPDTLAPQVPILLDVLTALGMPSVGAPGYEADDVIATLVARRAGPADVVTGDRDLLQLVDDAAGVRVLYTGRGVAQLEEIDAGEVRRRYGVEPAQYADFATLRGDPSDGLPGVAGIGEKTAAALLNRFGTLEALLAALDARTPALPPAQWRRLDAARAYLAVAPEVVRLARNAPVPAVDDRYPAVVADPDRLLALSERWGLGGSARRVVEALRR